MNKDMVNHIRAVSTVFIVFGILYLVAVLFLGITGLLVARNQAEASNIFILPDMLTGMAFLIPMGLVGLMHILTGHAFRTGKNWARIALWILAIINLGNVPVGTAIAGYTIWVLVKTREDVKAIR